MLLFLTVKEGILFKVLKMIMAHGRLRLKIKKNKKNPNTLKTFTPPIIVKNCPSTI